MINCGNVQAEGGKGKGKSKIAEKSMFHGKELHDKMGRSWMEPPREQRQVGPLEAYICLPVFHSGHCFDRNCPKG